jgi:ElaB/YqjD/DUF883 family membrane-anchored ribosome-binding protein
MADTAQRGSRSAPAEDAEVTKDLDALKAEIATLKLELERVTQAFKDVGVTALGAARGQGAAAVDRVKAEAEALADSVVIRGRGQLAVVEARVREQPLMALGLAFAAGLVFAKLSGR